MAGGPSGALFNIAPGPDASVVVPPSPLGVQLDLALFGAEMTPVGTPTNAPLAALGTERACIVGVVLSDEQEGQAEHRLGVVASVGDGALGPVEQCGRLVVVQRRRTRVVVKARQVCNRSLPLCRNRQADQE